MNQFIEIINLKINELPKRKKPKTGDVRALSAKIFKTIDNKSIDNVFRLCEQLLEQKSWALAVIAYDWAFRMKKSYNDNTFNIFEGWLHKYIVDWGDCDDFCTHAFGELISQRNQYFDKILKWTSSENFAVRRAAAVVLIYPINKDKYNSINPLLVSDILMHDSHYLVQKGYGWMLKVLSVKEPEKVYNYLKKHKSTMPRTAFRYALEKLAKDRQKELMAK